MPSVRVVRAKEIRSARAIGGRVYERTYYTLSLNLYVRKHVIERWGPEFVVIKDEDNGVIIIKPRKMAEQEGVAMETR